ncbi:MAG: preprotein translocase subunit SecY, partial [Pirellulales bacterium]
MLEKIRVIFTIPELRQKILLTLLLLAIYRIGWQIPLPPVDAANMTAFFGSQAQGGIADVIKQVAVFSASQLSQATIFGLGIMPYISASIIFQLLGSVWGPLERLQKEGETGRKKINEYTRYATVVICVVQSWAYVSFLVNSAGPGKNLAGEGLIRPQFLNAAGDGMPFGYHLITVLVMTAGTVFLMWLGEQIDEYGIGNGISLLIMAGILADLPNALFTLIGPVFMNGLTLGGDSESLGPETLLGLAVLFVA